MKRAARWIVRHRLPLTAVLLALSAVCGLLSFQVPINADMTKYLPADSAMKQGMDVMEREFGSLSLPPTLRVMIENLPAEEEAGALEKLRAFPAAASAVLSGRKREEGTSYTLFTVTLSAPYRTPEALETEHGIPGAFPDRRTTVRNDDANGMEIPLFIYAVAGAMLLAVLFTFCASWAEPFVFLAVLGAAILMNMGTNLLLGSVSVTTHSISAILQLVLSMDYSIILINRFRREYGTERDAEEAMARALAGAFPSIASSGMTTVVGLLMLVFMRFRIGADLGLVLAKGVFLSMVCCLTLLPAGILFGRRAIERTKKPSIHIPTRALAGFGFRGRRAVAGGFVLLFFGGWYLSGLSGISYSLNQEDPIAEIFPKENQIVLLYGNRDEAAAGSIAQALEKQDGVNSVLSWSTTFGAERSAEEMTDWLGSALAEDGPFAGLAGGMADTEIPALRNGLSPETVEALYRLYGAVNGDGPVQRLSLEQLVSFLRRLSAGPLAGLLAGENAEEGLAQAEEMMAQARSMLVGPEHSLMMISTSLPVEAEETGAFLEALEKRLREDLTEKYYLIGNSVMNREMAQSFGGELLTITLLTAGAILLVVLLTFRNLALPVILVSLVQCGVFLAVAATWLLGFKMYFLALLIVQCILMGATVDYGILLAGCYRECRKREGVREALASACAQSVHTVLTSSLFMIFVTGAIGFSPAEPTIAQICQSISLGAAAAVLLVLFVLPGLLAALDRFVISSRSSNG